MILGNLPINTSPSSSQEVKAFFDKLFVDQVTFPAEQIDAVVGFFLKKDFDIESARSIAIIFLNQAKIDQVGVFELLDTLKRLTEVQLSQVVAQVLNAYRSNISVLGYRVIPVTNSFDTRNILV